MSVRSQRFRLDADGRLFDMVADPGQENNVAARHPNVVTMMQAASARFIKELGDAIGPDDRPFPVGGAVSTVLPARDGVAHGGVKRSARAPNCSYFTNWTNKNDKITWDVEVVAAGEYEVVIYYTCPPADLGSKFAVVFPGARLTGEVTVANDPPLRGAESDRTPNRGGESYVKDFQPMSVGTINLHKGRGELTLQASEIPGDQVMDVRLIQLKKR